MLVDVPMPYGKPGTLKLPNSPLHLSATPAVVGRTMPEHGGDTDRIFAEWLGMAANEVGELRRRGIVK
jgi:crotonobetainyl-CoA:carnitine CoA-transferase CaiB-like acyl-CoA transferase